MFSPAKRRKKGLGKKFQDEVFAPAAKIPFDGTKIVPEKVGEYLKLAARVKNTSTEMLLAAVLPTTAACLGPNVRLRIQASGNHMIPPNLYLIGVGVPSCGKSQAYDMGMGDPLRSLARKSGLDLPLGEFTKAALLRHQSTLGGRGIICADEVSQSLNAMLKRSQADTSGERQLLLSLWGGRRYTSAYASKKDVDIERPSLCLGDFTQPDWYAELAEDISSMQDGLTERILFWLLPGKLCSQKKHDLAKRLFREKYALKDFDPVFQEIFDIHNTIDEKTGQAINYEDAIVYTFSPAAREHVCLPTKRIHAGLKESSMAILQDSSDSEEEEYCDPIITPLGLKFVDQLGRLALSLHCFTEVLLKILNFHGNLSLEREIPLSTVQNAGSLLQHLLNQGDMFNQSSEEVTKQRRTLQEGLMKRLLEEGGAVMPLRTLYRNKLLGKYVTSQEAEEACCKVQETGFGQLDSVKNREGAKSMRVFFKALPDTVKEESLAQYRVTMDTYRQQLLLPVTTASGLTAETERKHPQIAELDLLKTARKGETMEQESIVAPGLAAVVTGDTS